MRLNYGIEMLDCGMKSERDEDAVTSGMKRGVHRGMRGRINRHSELKTRAND